MRLFLSVADPLEQGFVSNPARPDGNITGFGNPDISIGGKLADLIKQMVPSITRVALVFNPEEPQNRLPAHVKLGAGTDAMRCLRLSDKGVLPWYTDCCRTPIGNTAASPLPGAGR